MCIKYLFHLSQNVPYFWIIFSQFVSYVMSQFFFRISDILIHKYNMLAVNVFGLDQKCRTITLKNLRTLYSFRLTVELFLIHCKKNKSNPRCSVINNRFQVSFNRVMKNNVFGYFKLWRQRRKHVITLIILIWFNATYESLNTLSCLSRNIDKASLWLI